MCFFKLNAIWNVSAAVSRRKIRKCPNNRRIDCVKKAGVKIIATIVFRTAFASVHF